MQIDAEFSDLFLVVPLFMLFSSNDTFAQKRTTIQAKMFESTQPCKIQCICLTNLGFELGVRIFKDEDKSLRGCYPTWLSMQMAMRSSALLQLAAEKRVGVSQLGVTGGRTGDWGCWMAQTLTCWKWDRLRLLEWIFVVTSAAKFLRMVLQKEQVLFKMALIWIWEA